MKITSGIGDTHSYEFDESDADYGTHTLPRKFWTSSKKGLLQDDDYKRRRSVKSERTARNKATRAEANRNKRSK